MVANSQGYKVHYKNGLIHRDDGPAVEFPDGYKAWYLYDNGYSFEEWLKLTPLSKKEKLKMRPLYAQ